jgi:hypothetical protein
MTNKEKGLKIAVDVCKWLDSKEGKKEIKATRALSEKTVNALRESRRVDSQTFYRPYNM